MGYGVVGSVVALALGASAALAQSEIPQPTPTGPGCWEWHYDPGQPIPENAKVVPGQCPTPDGRCYVVPSSGCFEITGVQKPLFRERPEHPPVLAPPPAPPPLKVFLPVGPPAERPTNPKGDVPPPPPQGGQCAVGQGWDFETFLENTTLYDLDGNSFTILQGHATFEGWKGGGQPSLVPSPFLGNRDIRAVAAPVYGNAIPIQRIRPPGWRPEIETLVGGDYWRFSQDINPHGDFWIGSLDRRYSWRQHPGEERDSWGEKAKGTLTSPECTLAAPFLAFRLGGSPHGSQRVELHVRGGRIRDYYGVRFLGGPGDSALGGAQGFGTQLNGPAAPQLFAPPVNQDGWTVVRSATPDGNSDWMRVFVFDLRPFVGRRIRIRIVDDRRDQSWELPNGDVWEEPEHLQADDFRFVGAPPEGTRWFPHSDGLCGGPGAGDGCSPVGRVPSEPPLWGVTDVHAHPMANLAFGGHVAWGDATDSLQRVYDCTQPLPAIAGPGGRPAIAPSHLQTQCYLHGSVVAIATVPLLIACAALSAVPLIGGAAAYVCTSAVALAAAIALNVPVLEGATMHGAAKVSSGAVKLGVLFSGLLDVLPDLELDFSPGLLPTTDSFGEATGSEADGWWKAGKAWHSPQGIGKTHNAYQGDMIRRAFEGGLRLGVWDVVNSRGFGLAADGQMTSDWTALHEGTAAAKRIVATSLADIAEIVYTPADAERVIRGGRMAVILGAEVDELGRMRPSGLPWPRSASAEPDAMHKQVEDLWTLGIRKITPVHATNNPIGGAALFNTIYNANNYFVSGTPSDGPMTSADHPAVSLFLDGSFGADLAGLFLGEFSLAHDPVQPAAPPWNPMDWFDFDQRESRLDDRYVGDYARITYRMGLDGADKLMRADGTWLPADEVVGDQLIKPTLMKGLSLAFAGPTCNLYNTVLPGHGAFTPVIKEHYLGIDGHRNALGLFRSDAGTDGYAFLRAAMKKGMLIDTDHLSQNARVDLYQLTESYALEANWPRGQCLRPDGRCGACDATATEVCGAYPTVGVHSKVRGLEIEPKHTAHDAAFRDPFRNKYGYNDEASRSEEEVRWVARNGGAFAVFPTGSTIIPPNTLSCTKDSDCASDRGLGPVCLTAAGGGRQCAQINPALAPRDFALPPEVHNDCDSSSKTFAVKYLWLMRTTRGRGLTPATDFNGLIGPLKPRYGWSAPWNRPCGGNARDFTDQGPGLPGFEWHPFMIGAQGREASGVWYDDYAARAPFPAFAGAFGADPRYKEVVARGAGEEREDRAPRGQVDDHVFYNDFGPDNQPSPAYQDGNRAGAQMYPMKRWRKIGGRAGWDFNLDGLAHIGLYPDLFQDMRNVGVQWEQLGPLFHSAAEYIGTWKKAVAIGAAHQ
jgi:microsomal dipeptidase-like Zn-dependent dipeptidase